jgi:hypothetical protein
MSDGRIARWSPVSGFVFVALFVVGIILNSDVPGAGSSDAKIRSYFSDDGNQLKLEVAYYVVTVGVAFFIWFVGLVAGRVREAEGQGAWLARIVVASGTASALVMLAGFAANSMVAATADHTTRFRIDPDTARVITDFAYPLTFETGLPLAAPFVLATALALRQGDVIPRWLGWAGIAVAFTCIVGFLGVPMALFFAWVVILGVLLLRRRHPA